MTSLRVDVLTAVEHGDMGLVRSLLSKHYFDTLRASGLTTDQILTAATCYEDQNLIRVCLEAGAHMSDVRAITTGGDSELVFTLASVAVELNKPDIFILCQDSCAWPSSKLRDLGDTAASRGHIAAF